MTPERKVKTTIRQVLDLHRPDIYYDMPVPSGYGKSTLDFIGCYYGRFFAIEAKALGEPPRPRQEGTIEDMRLAGGQVFVVDGPETLVFLSDWLFTIKRMRLGVRS